MKRKVYGARALEERFKQEETRLVQNKSLCEPVRVKVKINLSASCL